MKLPRDLSGADLVVALRRLGYQQTRQTGSHVRMTTGVPREGHVTVPLARAVPTGTLAALLKDVAAQLDMSVEDVPRRIR